MTTLNSQTVQTRPVSRKNRSKVKGFFFHLTYTIISAVMLGPLIWIFLLSFKTQREYSTNMLGFPKTFHIENYIKAFTDSPFPIFLKNSLFVTFASLLMVLIVSSLAGYALARIEFRGARPLFALFIMCDAVPIFILIIPLFILLYQLKLAETLWGLVFAYTAMRIGLSVMLMRSFFRSIPTDMEDAGKIDGASLLQIIWYVMLPIIRPGLLVTAIVNFITLWNEYFLATILLPSQALFTLPPGLAAAFMGRFSSNWPVMAAGFTLSFLPALLIFVFAQDKIVAGWTVSSK